jgi:dolichol-phosphate mannosyltransferase
MNQTPPIMKALVVIPTYNEKENLPLLVSEVLAKDERISVLVVDDNSPDGTGHLADEMAAQDSRIHTSSTRQQGLGKAYLAGF